MKVVILPCPCRRSIPSNLLEPAKIKGIRCNSCNVTYTGNEIIKLEQSLHEMVGDPKKLARSNDPDTSHQGATFIAPKLGEEQDRALRFVGNYPDHTAAELAQIAGDTEDTRRIGKRLPELEEFGLIVRGDKRKCKISNRQAHVWSINKGKN